MWNKSIWMREIWLSLNSRSAEELNWMLYRCAIIPATPTVPCRKHISSLQHYIDIDNLITPINKIMVALMGPISPCLFHPLTLYMTSTWNPLLIFSPNSPNTAIDVGRDEGRGNKGAVPPPCIFLREEGSCYSGVGRSRFGGSKMWPAARIFSYFPLDFFLATPLVKGSKSVLLEGGLLIL